MTGLRNVIAMRFPDLAPGGANMPRPEYIEVDPTSLLIDASYQRSLSDRSRDLIRRLIRDWDWCAYKPPNVVRVGDDLHIIDGQHTAIAAASHPLVGKIPVLLVSAPEIANRAAAFVKVNRDRVRVTPVQMHKAMVAARDDDAVTVQQVCDRAGIVLVEARVGPNQSPRAGEATAIATIYSLVKKHGALGARRILSIVAKAKQAPLRTTIRAVELSLYSGHELDEEDIVTVLRGQLPRMMRSAESKRAEDGSALWLTVGKLLIKLTQEAGREPRRAA